jgi:hypothetical protein
MGAFRKMEKYWENTVFKVRFFPANLKDFCRNFDAIFFPSPLYSGMFRLEA